VRGGSWHQVWTDWLTRHFVTARSIRALSLALLMWGLSLTSAAQLAFAGAQAASVSITSDKTQYRVGDAVSVCWTVSNPGPVTIDLTHADGSVDHLYSGLDDGRGGCFSGTIVPPTGTECVELNAPSGSPAETSQACFQIQDTPQS